MSKESMDERFDEELPTFIQQAICSCCTQMGSGHSMAYLKSEKIKAFLCKELADQKARAIDIVRERQLDINARHAYPDGAQGIEACEAIATVLEEKL